MPDTPEKRRLKAKKRKKRELKAIRKRMRKEGLLGRDSSGLFPPGERPRETVDASPLPPPPSPEEQAGEPAEGDAPDAKKGEGA